jgi:4-diphosphocytidyl-2-C-methyl-D-erythritol kinase
MVGLRSDGYHLIDAEMVSLDLADELTFSEGQGITVTGPFAAGVPTDSSNLAARALAAAGLRSHISIDKQIPAQGGLGGGSSDAAAVLRWAGVSDVSLAASLGADVPFCLVGGRARVTGIGEVVEALPPQPRLFTLLLPPFGVSTVAAYRAWDELGGPRADGPNDLEPAALVVEPRLAAWRDRLTEVSGTTATLAGSGSTWFVEGHHPDVIDAFGHATVILASSSIALG